MSVCFVGGLAPAGKPHPATKWSLLMALLVVVVLGVPKIAAASQPNVQPPTGAQSGGVFTGTYTFSTTIYCTGGPTFNSSYSNNLDGTHSFAFYGSADGSLLVSIDGGGLMLITSCGDPLTGPDTNVATYSVSKGSPPPPTPTPSTHATPTPSSAPHATPTPTPSGGSGSGKSVGSKTGSGGAGSTKSPAAGTPTPSTSATPLPPAVGAGTTPTPLAGVPVTKPTTTSSDTAVSASAAPAASRHILAWTTTGFILLLLVVLALLIARSRRLRDRLHAIITPLWLRIEPYWFRFHYAWHKHAPATPYGRDEPKRRGLSPHRHSGRLMAHHHTSYPALAFLLLVSGVLAAAVSYSTQAAGSVISLTVTGPPPTQAATIDDPTDGEHVGTSSITVRGTCPSGLLIEIDRNGTFAGSTMCDANDLYSVLITLVPNENDLVARDADGLGQYGPDSPTIAVFYDAPPPPTPSLTPTPSATPKAPAGRQATTGAGKASPTPSPTPAGPATLLLSTNQHLFEGAGIGTSVQWPVTISGGRRPYKVTWEWGDDTADGALEAPFSGAVQMEHEYSKAGAYQVTIRAQDAAGNQAVLQVVTIVNGTATAATAIGKSTPDGGGLVAVWPLLSLSGLVVASFWLGERHKLSLLFPFSHQPA